MSHYVHDTHVQQSVSNTKQCKQAYVFNKIQDIVPSNPTYIKYSPLDNFLVKTHAINLLAGESLQLACKELDKVKCSLSVSQKTCYNIVPRIIFDKQQEINSYSTHHRVTQCHTKW